MITFANRARNNLNTRIAKHLGVGASRYVTVVNFHGFGTRLVRSHGYLVGRSFDHSRPGQRGSLKQLTAQVADAHGLRATQLREVVRAAKDGAFSDDEVMTRLSSSSAGTAYEQRLRALGRLDFDDAIRLGLLILQQPGVVDLYRQHFAAVFVDEVQDLSLTQYQLIEGIGMGRTLFAGDRAQGIYRFAGAAPDEVYALIRGRCGSDGEERLRHSFRSAPAIVRLVGAIGQKLKGDQVHSAPEVEWDGPGVVEVHRFATTTEETEWLVDLLARWQAQHPDDSIGVMVRARWRRGQLDAAVHEGTLQASIWDYPAHRPRIVQLLARHVEAALDATADELDALEELYQRCFADLSVDDLDTQDELLEAIESIREACASEPLHQVVRNIRQLVDPNAPVPAGVHLLNAHVGKGQQFDRVIVVGMEEGHIPGRMQSEADYDDELATFLVMVSRARHTLLFTFAQRQTTSGRGRPNEQSRWLAALDKYCSAGNQPMASTLG